MVDGQEQKLLNAIVQTVRQGEHVLAAVSGGADSVALMHLLLALRNRGAIRLSVAHFEHGIRGEASLEDMRFVQRECEQEDIPVVVGRGDVPAEAERLRRGLEETARDMRRAFLLQAKEETGADVIALAHHADDQAETVIMRLLRGSGGRGVAGMRARDGAWCRPLLHCRKQELIEYLAQRGVTWREDATNAEEITPRNSLRLRVMPELEKIWPGAVEAISRFAKVQTAESDFLDKMAREWLMANAHVGPKGVRVALKDAPERPLLARAMKILAGKSALHTDIERLCALCASGKGRLVFRADVYTKAEMAAGEIWLQKEETEREKVPIYLQGETKLGDLGRLIAQPGEGRPVRDDPFCQELDGNACEGAMLRLWQDGDRIKPLGMHGKSRLLSDIYADRHIAPPRRKYMPVLEKDGEILWAIGACIAERAKLTEGSRPLRLRWQEEEEKPWRDTMEKMGGTDR